MRFKFQCNCGKRLAAYSWMVGKVTECPKCRTTMTIPTPERAAELSGAQGEELARRYGYQKVERSRWRTWELVLAGLVLAASVAVGAILSYLYFYLRFHTRG